MSSSFFHKWLYEFNYYDDPLLDTIRFPLVDRYIKPYVPFGKLQTHIHELIFFYFLYSFIFTLSEHLSPRLLKRVWKTMKLKDQIYFHIHVVSMVQCIIILVLIFPMFNDPVLLKDRVFGYTPYGGMIASAASGYFLWDTISAVYFIKYFGLSFAVHGLVSFVVSFVAFYPFIMYYAPVFLLFEISTPFLNIRWFDLKLPGYFSEGVILVNNIMLICMFFFVRICWGWYQIAQLAVDFWAAKEDPRFPWTFASFILGGNLVLDVLNVYWFSLMANVAYRTVKRLVKGERKDLQIDEETIKRGKAIQQQETEKKKL